MADNPHREAARWWVRMGGSPPAEAESDAFQRWLAQSPENAAAWEDAETAWSLAGSASDVAIQVAPRPPRKAWIPAAVAAGVGGLAILAAAGGGMLGLRRDSDAAPPQALATGLGELRRIALSDGSLLTLDADTAVSIRMTRASREVHLSRGRAHFEVAHDVRRPFQVLASGATVTATGTSFDVNLLTAGVDVVLLRGGVDVRSGGQVVRLHPGEHVAAGRGGPLQTGEIESDAAAGWLQGRLSFHDEALGDIAAEMNRYSGARLRISDPRLAQARFSGVFLAGDSAALAEAVHAARAVAVTRRDDEILIGPSTSR